MPDLADVRRAAELVAFGLGRTRPVDGSDYRILLDRYRSDLTFRNVVDTVATGLGLVVLGTPRSGLVLRPDVGSQFATRLSDLRQMDPEDRAVAGLVLVALAAYAYPTDGDLDDPEAKIVEVGKLDAFIRSAAAKLTSPDTDADTPLGRARAAADIYVDLPPVRLSERGRRVRGCTYRAIEEVCGWLVDRGAARETPALGADTYQLTDRFRLLVAESAASDALDVLRDVRRSSGATR
jgi:hypothetical protein